MCASVLERNNLIASPFTSPLKCVLISRWLVVLNLPPLNRFRSRNSTRSSLMLHVNFSVLCALLSLSKNLSSSLLVPTQMHSMSSM